MKVPYFLIFYLAFCMPVSAQIISEDLLKLRQKEDVFSYVDYDEDSVFIEVFNDHYNFTVYFKNGNLEYLYDLTELGIETKTPGEIKWVNKDFACMSTWWSGPFSRHIFLPMKAENSLVYIEETFESMNSETNNVTYFQFDDLGNQQLISENLLTRERTIVRE